MDTESLPCDTDSSETDSDDVSNFAIIYNNIVIIAMSHWSWVIASIYYYAVASYMTRHGITVASQPSNRHHILYV